MTFRKYVLNPRRKEGNDMNLKAKLLVKRAKRYGKRMDKLNDKGLAIEAKLSKMIGHGITQDEYDHLEV